MQTLIVGIGALGGTIAARGVRAGLRNALWADDVFVDFDKNLSTAIAHCAGRFGWLASRLGESTLLPFLPLAPMIRVANVHMIAKHQDSIEEPGPPRGRPASSYPRPPLQTG